MENEMGERRKSEPQKRGETLERGVDELLQKDQLDKSRAGDKPRKTNTRKTTKREGRESQE
jgi:hypothetical protein